MSLITIIGRGHSGTRAIAHTLYASGVYMGHTINASGDKVPPDDLYAACRIMAKHVTWCGGLKWNFDALHEGAIDPEFVRLVQRYLDDVLQRQDPRGWKLPETTLIYPWIVRLYPEAQYISWMRDPRDSIIGRHLTDDLSDFGVPYPPTEDERERRAISWKYQYDLVRATPQPRRLLAVRYEDFVLDQERTLSRLEEFLGFPLARVIVRPEPVGRWKKDEQQHYFDFLRTAMVENGYTEGLPEAADSASPVPS